MIEFNPLRPFRPTDILSQYRLPAKLNAEQAAALLGFAAHDIPILVANKFMLPLGKPPQNCVKWFATMDIEALMSDRKWLDQATKAITQHWQGKNALRRRLTNEQAVDATT